MSILDHARTTTIISVKIVVAESSCRLVACVTRLSFWQKIEFDF